jgi:hypothetical protein
MTVVDGYEISRITNRGHQRLCDFFQGVCKNDGRIGRYDLDFSVLYEIRDDCCLHLGRPEFWR